MTWWDDVDVPPDLVATWRAAPQGGRDGLLSVARKDGRRRRRRTAEFKALVAHHSKKRQMLQTQRTPSWADMSAVRAVYLEAARLQDQTGIPHHVDHIYPLNGRLVSGLHVADNLQAVPAEFNLRKSNSTPSEWLEELAAVRNSGSCPQGGKG